MDLYAWPIFGIVQKLLVGMIWEGTSVQERLAFHDLAPFNIYIVPGVCITAFLLF